jgi:soluble lytic murein transglycosylase-like protein
VRIDHVFFGLVLVAGSACAAFADPRDFANPYGGLRPSPAPASMIVPVAAAPAVPPPAAVALAVLSREQRMHAFRAIAAREAREADMPFDLVDAVMKIESDYGPDRIGDVGEIGLMQVRPTTAAMLGFRGLPGQLADPAVNIHFGTLYLSQAWHLAKGDVCRALMKYRAGHGQDTMSALSSTYCARAQAHLVAVSSPLAATIKPSDLIATLEVDGPAPGARGAKGGQMFWTTFQARIKKINARLEAKWKRVATR